MYVYKITNKVNNKIYIGQTIRQIEDRFKRHINDAVNNILDTHLARAIRKYGADSFIISQIDQATSQEELTAKEYEWIIRLDSTNPEIGYNETASMNKCGGNTYQSKTETELKEIGDKIRRTKVGSKNPNSAAIKCLNVETNEELFFDTVRECRDYFKEENHRFITTRVNHSVKGLYKGKWAISYLGDEYQYCKVVNKAGRKIFCDGTKYESIRLMCRENDINRSLVIKHIGNGENNFTINNHKISVLN